MTGTLRGVLLAAALLATGSHANAALIQVSQESAPGAGDFNANVLGYVHSINGGGQTTAAIYNYVSASYTGTLVPAVNNSQQSFFVDTAEGLTFFHILDAIGGGGAGTAALLFNLTNDTVSLFVQDDAGEIVLGGGGATITGAFAFSNNAMDGIAFGTLDGDAWLLDVSNTAAPTGLALGWRVVGSNQTINLSQATGRRVRFDSVPEPGSFVLLTGGLLALVWARRRRS